MPAETPVSIEECLSTTYDPVCDYVDGRVLERNWGEQDHSRLQGVLFAHLFHREKQWGTYVLPEQRAQVSPTRFRVPDICVIAGPRPCEQIFTHPPLLCNEILSKDDTMPLMR